MSSLAAARADNFYRPPEWEPKHGGLNKFNGGKSMLARAKKGDAFVVRFEMMYNSWCEGCKGHIGRGIRYNARKRPVGKYHSLTIWEFKMNCRMCSHEFVIRTRPQERDYEFVSGVRRKNEEFTAADNETLELADDETKERMAKDPMFRIERAEASVRRAQDNAPSLRAVMARHDDRTARRRELNAALRKEMREAKKDVRRRETLSRARGLGITLLPESAEDARTAAEVMSRRKRRRTGVENASASAAKASRAAGVLGTTSASTKARLLAASRGINPRLLRRPTPSRAGVSSSASDGGDWSGIFSGAVATTTVRRKR